MQMRREAGIRSPGERRVCEPNENYPEVTLIPIRSSFSTDYSIAEQIIFPREVHEIRRAMN